MMQQGFLLKWIRTQQATVLTFLFKLTYKSILEFLCVAYNPTFKKKSLKCLLITEISAFVHRKYSQCFSKRQRKILDLHLRRPKGFCISTYCHGYNPYINNGKD